MVEEGPQSMYVFEGTDYSKEPSPNCFSFVCESTSLFSLSVSFPNTSISFSLSILSLEALLYSFLSS